MLEQCFCFFLVFCVDYFSLNVSFMIRCNILRKTNPVLHTHITPLSNYINKILRELVSSDELLPFCLNELFSPPRPFTKQ